METTASSIDTLKTQISVARIKMQNLWNERGYTDEDVLQSSIELDNLLNQYQRLWIQNSIYQK